MILKKLIKVLEERFPKEMAESWDNVGLLVGDMNWEVKKVMLTLDCTEEAIEKAIGEGVDLIITHHPLIFSPIKTITTNTILGKKILKLVENKIGLYSMHTNLDSNPEGLNEYFGKKLGFIQGKIIEENIYKDNSYGIGRVYKIENISLEELVGKVKKDLSIDKVRVVTNDLNKEIKKVALVNGSGMSYWRASKKMGADILITGDVRYHEALDALEENMDIIDIGHYEGEKIFVDILNEFLYNYVEIINFDRGPVFKTY